MNLSGVPDVGTMIELGHRARRAVQVLFGGDLEAEVVGKLVADGLRDIAASIDHVADVERLRAKVEFMEVLATRRLADAVADAGDQIAEAILETEVRLGLGIKRLEELEERRVQALESIAASLVKLLADQQVGRKEVRDEIQKMTQALIPISAPRLIPESNLKN